MDRNSVELTQRPTERTVTEYDRARDRIVDEFADRPGVRTVYDYGTVEHPGISDLDLMLVFDRGADPEWEADLSTDFDPLVDELVGHGNIIVVDDATFADLHYIDPGLEPHHLAGAEVDRNRPTDEEATYRDYASVMDWLPERVYQVERLRDADEIPVMRTLQLLKSLGYSLCVAADLLGDQSVAAFVETVADLRGSWFDRAPDDREAALVETIERGRETGRGALAQWFDTQPETVFEDGGDERLPGALSYFDDFAYVAGETGVTREREWTLVGIPDPWFAHYQAYARQDGSLAALIAKSMVGDAGAALPLTESYKAFLARKLDICTANFEWVQQLGFDSGAFRFGFLLGRTDWDDEEFVALRETLRGFTGE